MTGTVLHDVPEGASFGDHQARLIDVYRTTWRDKHGSEPPPVAASILAGTIAGLRETYAAYDRQRRTEGMGASRPKGVLTPVIGADLPAGMRISPVFHSTPDEVTEAVLANPGQAAAEEIVLFLPPAFGLAENVQLLTDAARTVAPHRGWDGSPQGR
ncbi:hypothetical protein [Amycolatopsis methanolica]|uniref:hypothetical protein n=1 Tax=Amycolatopsis methanolica TaxID=1814 RepID=UPI00341252FB